jgi:hypothetical protein
VVSLNYAAALTCRCSNSVFGISFTKFNPAPNTLTLLSGMDNMDNRIVAFHMEWCIRMVRQPGKNPHSLTSTIFLRQAGVFRAMARLFFSDAGDHRDHDLCARAWSLGADSGSLDLPVERHSREIGKVGPHRARHDIHCNKQGRWGCKTGWEHSSPVRKLHRFPNRSILPRTNTSA